MALAGRRHCQPVANGRLRYMLMTIVGLVMRDSRIKRAGQDLVQIESIHTYDTLAASRERGDALDDPVQIGVELLRVRVVVLLRRDDLDHRDAFTGEPQLQRSAVSVSCRHSRFCRIVQWPVSLL